MKKLLLAIGMTIVAGAASAQYYSLSFLNAGQNPGGINNDEEQTVAYMLANYTGYSEILSPGETGWSSAQTIPFSFSFNGTAVSSYSAAASGVLSFSSALGTAPTSTNSALPSASIPDQSVCAWGLNLSGANDGVISKTFGTAPNRQHWVIWASASASGVTGWTYWGIVLEETSNSIHIVDMRTYNGNTALTVGVQIDGSTAFSIGNAVQSTNTATGGSSLIEDNSYYSFMYGIQPAVDLALSSVEIPSFASPSESRKITGKVTNLGANAISSFDVVWTDGTNTKSQTISMNVASGGSANFTHDDMVTVSAGATATVNVTVEATGDANLANNSLSGSVDGYLFIPNRAVVGEEATGTWCGWCPRGLVGMEYMEETYEEEWIGIAVHNNDPMENADYDSWMGSQISGYPSGLVDRGGDIDPSSTSLENAFMQRIGTFGLANIEVLPFHFTQSDSFELRVWFHFAGDYSDNLRVAAIIVEDDLTGTGSDWAQVNYYSGGANGTLSGGGVDWHSAAGSVTGVVFNDVAREALTEIDGDNGILPSTVEEDQFVSYTFDRMEWNSDYDLANTTVVVMLIDGNTDEVINAAEAHIIPTEISEIDGKTVYITDGGTYEYYSNGSNEIAPLGVQDDQEIMITVFPNPAQNFVTINGVEGNSIVKIYDVQGRMVSNQTISTKTLDVSSLVSGMYNVQIENNGVSVVRRISIVK